MGPKEKGIAMAISKREFLGASVGIAGVGFALSGEAAAQTRSVKPLPYGKLPTPGAYPAQYEWSGRQLPSADPDYKPRRLNKAVELLEDGQPIYYVSYAPTMGDGYEIGLQMARTWADAICIEVENGAFDLINIRDFMRGLVDGGPTRSGHRMPATFVTMPNIGFSEAQMQASAWMIEQVLAAGVMGINICHARDAAAIEVAVQAIRYPFDYPGTPKLSREGLRGSGSQLFASRIWGVHPNHYLHIADLWPLNPKGELILGLKIEDHVALDNCEKTLAMPGVTFAEWGPGDMNMSLNGLAAFPDPPPPRRPEMGFGGPSSFPSNVQAARRRVMAACKANGVRLLDIGNEKTVVDSIRQGAMIMETNEATALIGRTFTKRKMPA